MTSVSPRIRSAVLRAREQLAEGRQKLRQQHDSGSPGIQVCALATELLDEVVLGLYHDILAEMPAAEAEQVQENLALVALGGYGRRDVAPFSDVDLMLLHAGGADEIVAPVARQLMLDLYDANLDLGNSLRTPEEATKLARHDSTVLTALVEARLLTGSEPLFDRFRDRFRREARRRFETLRKLIEHSRAEERNQFGDTVCLLEPNVKRSPGALRDLQLIRWIGFCRYGEQTPAALTLAGALLKVEEDKLRAARDFLLRVRNELHFHRGKAYDVLDKGEQVRIAEWLRYPSDPGLLSVERFMREYFEHTTEVRTIMSHFVEGTRRPVMLKNILGFLFSHQVEGDFRVGPLNIKATRSGLGKLKGNIAEVLRLLELANLYSKSIDYETWRAIREDMTGPREVKLTRDASERFLSLLSHSGPLADSLRRLHELRVLEKLVPAMSHARFLPQFNDYHKFTVDEHSIRAVECATGFAARFDDLGEAYRSLKPKRTLHLALLLHDLGKGFPDDHSEVGLRLAAETAERFRLPLREAEAIKFLVHKHLVMSHLALRRDITDDSVVVKFAVEIGSPELLQMLYLLTCADLAAVGPGVLNDWKLELLTSLYHRALFHLAGESTTSFDERLEKRRRGIEKLVKTSPESEWWAEQIEKLPAAYVNGSGPEKIVEELDRVRKLPRRDAVAWGRVPPNRNAVEYTVGTHEEICPGIFQRLTGALTSKGQSILSAEIHTLPDNLVLDRFYVEDQDFTGAPPPERLEEVSRALVAALKDETGARPVFRRRWQSSAVTTVEAAQLPTQVRIDNNTSEQYTIIDVFAHDQMGLLYAITHALFELGLSVGGAKIGTHLDQVVDVFYVTDQGGRKIDDDARQNEIRSRLLDAIERLRVEVA